VITWGTAVATLAAPLVFLLPGWALLSLVLPPESFAAERRPDGASWLILAAGLTLAITPVGLLFLYLVGLRVGSGIILALLAASAAIVIWRRGPKWWAVLRRERGMSWREHLAWLDAPFVALLVVVLLTLGVRLWVVRGVNVGFWGDSYQHTMMSQLILDNGGLFESWQPYVPLSSFTYHFGFHGDVALFQWATDWLADNATPRTVVLVGQFLNALAVLSLYPLTVRLSGGNRWAGVIAVLVAGLLSVTPMFYVNWGRYTQLAGQAILPAAIWFTMETVETARLDLRRICVAGVTVAGLGLTHYRVSLFYAIFMLPYLLYLLVWARQTIRRWPQPVLNLAGTALVAILLLSPWLWQLGSGLLPGNLASYHQGGLPDRFQREYNAFTWKFSPAWLLWVALAGALWALFRRSQVFLVAIWTGLLFLIANLPALGLPDTGLYNNFAVLIGLYVPVGMLVGYLAGELLSLAINRWPILSGPMLALVFAVAGLGAVARADVLDPGFQIVTPADEQAMTWIRENTPRDARFLTNAFFAYGDYVVVGSDAGWWIPLLTSRGNTVPPLNYSMEVADPPDYREQVNALIRQTIEGDLKDPDMVRYLQDQGITHVYIGRTGGPLLDPQTLQSSPHYDLLYEHDGVFIFTIRPPQASRPTSVDT